MRLALIVTVAAVLTCSDAWAAENSATNLTVAPAGMKGSYETVQGTVLKAFVVDDNGARFRAYLVKWKDFDVIVSDTLARTDKKEGDTITFIVSRSELPLRDKTVSVLQFVVHRPRPE